MKALSYKTKSAKKGDIERNWYIVDAEDQTLGRMASKISHVLQGKNKPTYTPNLDTGDYVIVTNAEKVRLTGNKLTQKEYITYSGYPDGQKRATAKEMLDKKPIYVVEKAVKGMLPKTKLGRAMAKKLFVYEGDNHKHKAQQPKKLEI